MFGFSGIRGTALIAIATILTLSLGAEAAAIFTSPVYGLDEIGRSQLFYCLGLYLDLSRTGVLMLAAFLGGLKLAVAALCGLHLVQRLLVSGNVDSAEMFKGGLVALLAVCLALLGPVLWLRIDALAYDMGGQAALAVLALALLASERRTAPVKADEVMMSPDRAGAYSPWR